MSKTIIVNQQREYTPYTKTVNITEKRATSDDSVRLMNEFIEKAKKNIINQIELKTTWINSIIISYEISINRDVEYMFRFNINGVDRAISIIVSNAEQMKAFSEQMKVSPNDGGYMVNIVVKKLSEYIAIEISKELENAG